MVENTDAELAELKKKLAAIDRKIDKFYDFVCDGGNVDDRARERYRAMKEEYSNYSKQIEKKRLYGLLVSPEQPSENTLNATGRKWPQAKLLILQALLPHL